MFVKDFSTRFGRVLPIGIEAININMQLEIEMEMELEMESEMELELSLRNWNGNRTGNSKWPPDTSVLLCRFRFHRFLIFPGIVWLAHGTFAETETETASSVIGK